jgi:hypothetical protein
MHFADLEHKRSLLNKYYLWLDRPQYSTFMPPLRVILNGYVIILVLNNVQCMLFQTITPICISSRNMAVNRASYAILADLLPNIGKYYSLASLFSRYLSGIREIYSTGWNTVVFDFHSRQIQVTFALRQRQKVALAQYAYYRNSIVSFLGDKSVRA